MISLLPCDSPGPVGRVHVVFWMALTPTRR